MSKMFDKVLLKFLKKGKERITKLKNELDEIEIESSSSKSPMSDDRDIKRIKYGRWSVFDNGAHDEKNKTLYGYFGRGGDSFARIVSFEDCKQFFNKLRRAERKSLVLDVMGQAKIGLDLNADLSVGWTYNSELVKKVPGIKLESGDLFDKKIIDEHFQNLDSLVNSDGYDLNAVFFRTIGGLGRYYNNLYAVSYLYERIFMRIFTLMNVGSKMYLSLGYGESRNETNYAEKLMVVLKGMGYEIDSDSRGNYVITKSSLKGELPNLKIINSVQPLITLKTLRTLKRVEKA